MGASNSSIARAGAEGISADDPRSPTRGVQRTPVRDYKQAMRYDPRSPSQGITRTPVQLGDPAPPLRGSTPSRGEENDGKTNKKLFTPDSDRAPLVDRN